MSDIDKITMKDLFDCVAGSAKWFVVKGYSFEQEHRRDEASLDVIRKVWGKFPELKDNLNIGRYEGLGYYDRHSDFSVRFDDFKMIAVRTGTSDIKPVHYKTEYHRGIEEVCEHFGIKDIDNIPVMKMVQYCNNYRLMNQRKEIEEEISSLERKLAEKKDKVRKINEYLGKQPIDLFPDNNVKNREHTR